MYRMKLNKKKQFYLTLTSSNGKTLFVTESFTQKPSAWRNIQATLKTIKGKQVIVQDDTLKDGPIVYKVTPTKITVARIKPRK